MQQAGDVPVVGDSNGDGLTRRICSDWILYEWKQSKTYTFGGVPGDVVGDWKGG